MVQGVTADFLFLLLAGYCRLVDDYIFRRNLTIWPIFQAGIKPSADRSAIDKHFKTAFEGLKLDYMNLYSMKRKWEVKHDKYVKEFWRIFFESKESMCKVILNKCLKKVENPREKNVMRAWKKLFSTMKHHDEDRMFPQENKEPNSSIVSSVLIFCPPLKAFWADVFNWKTSQHKAEGDRRNFSFTFKKKVAARKKH